MKPIKRVNSNLMMSKISKYMQIKTEAHSSITNSQISLGDTNSDIREHLKNNPIRHEEKLPIISKLERKDSSTSLERKESIMTRFNSTTNSRDEIDYPTNSQPPQMNVHQQGFSTRIQVIRTNGSRNLQQKKQVMFSSATESGFKQVSDHLNTSDSSLPSLRNK